jgi:molybdopterin converting factor subunit 1
MNKVKVLFFATLQARAGTASTELELPANANVQDLKQLLIQRFPQLESFLGSTLVSINREFAFDGDIIPSGAEVALFPPVSGGSTNGPTIFAITEITLTWTICWLASPCQRPVPPAFSRAWCAASQVGGMRTTHSTLSMKPTNPWRKPRCARWRMRSVHAGPA